MPSATILPSTPQPKAMDLPASIADYLARERVSDVRHEFYPGEIIEMPGGTFEHGNITTDFLIALAFLLRGVKSDCEVHGEGQRIFIEPGIFYYPDVCVVCGEPQVDFEEALRNPIVVVEVLSESTKHNDRNEKLHQYQRIDSLRHYLLVEQNIPRIEHYKKDTATGAWQKRPTLVEGMDTNLPIAALNVSVPLSEIYRWASFVMEAAS